MKASEYLQSRNAMRTIYRRLHKSQHAREPLSLPSFRIASTARLEEGNPYVMLFHNALSAHGMVYAGQFQPTLRWLASNLSYVDALHFQWADRYFTRGGRVSSFIERLTGSKHVGAKTQSLVSYGWSPCFGAFLQAARRTGLKIVWTLHNVEPHEGGSDVQRRGFRQIAKAADVIICHDETTRDQCLGMYSTTADVVVMPHGNYDGAYPRPRPISEVREELELRNDVPVVACLGRLRQYKGIEIACEAIEQLEGGVQLLVAGKPRPEYAAEVESLAAATKHAKFILRGLSSQEFADFTSASDVMLLPYHRVSGSGALLAALTLGRGVVASNLDHFRNVLSGHPSAGQTFQSGSPPCLASAIKSFLAIPGETRQAAARSLADAHSWSKVVAPVVESIRSC